MGVDKDGLDKGGLALRGEEGTGKEGERERVWVCRSGNPVRLAEGISPCPTPLSSRVIHTYIHTHTHLKH